MHICVSISIVVITTKCIYYSGQHYDLALRYLICTGALYYKVFLFG